MTKTPVPPPFDPHCTCTHAMNLHRPIGEGVKRRLGPCSVGQGPKGTVCGCPGYHPEMTS